MLLTFPLNPEPHLFLEGTLVVVEVDMNITQCGQSLLAGERQWVKGLAWSKRDC